ncbi:hypothetical protein BJ138DRAFT_1105446 [Hygrophoropsis aurantiaca]|uniref:Uncharacterized protein n=1 Tax=Hygrophoropsis aurantiaca TaxID=72124 RepID=A0ACB7ZZ02_9AGAM|nr:hypothetical protein BJ138DRAFT_1105446 [Hygrophoropsis aurantiaca]
MANFQSSTGNVHEVDIENNSANVDIDGHLYSFPLSELQCYFRPGDHLRVIEGICNGFKGFVVLSIDGVVEVPQYSVELWETLQVINGPYQGLQGSILWITNERDIVHVEIPDDEEDSLGPDTVPVPISSITHWPPANTLQFSVKKGYDVSVGDSVRLISVISDRDSMKVEFPIPFCIKIADWGNHVPIYRNIGREVYVISGEKKGQQATLRSVGVDTCVVALDGIHVMQLKNSHVATSSGILMSGASLSDPQIQALNAFRRASDSSTGEGIVAWLFNANFCDFAKYHLCFNVGAGFDSGRLVPRVVRTVCPNRFCGNGGPAPDGCVSVFCTSHSGGSINYYDIPARHLTPTDPQQIG